MPVDPGALRVARDSGAIGFKLRMDVPTCYNGTSGRSGKFTSTPRGSRGKVLRLSATLVCRPNLLTSILRAPNMTPQSSAPRYDRPNHLALSRHREARRRRDGSRLQGRGY